MRLLNGTNKRAPFGTESQTCAECQVNTGPVFSSWDSAREIWPDVTCVRSHTPSVIEGTKREAAYSPPMLGAHLHFPIQDHGVVLKYRDHVFI